ncbi:hypothetical protein [Massilia sp. BSC265]|uniref:hypothetical protein n=1 Tax=Massilia sp. BSC265 TaxID=1549812 RepID=UPI000A590D08|nr:hypothetical protein [Massilia sp. BSC265]
MQSVVCATGQLRQVLEQVRDLFAIKSDYDLGLMTPSQTLNTLTARTFAGNTVDVTERPEALAAGTVKLVGTAPSRIVDAILGREVDELSVDLPLPAPALAAA